MAGTIKVRYEWIDSYGRGTTRSFKTLAGAQKWAQKWIGAHPEMGGWYAVSDDGIGKITCRGCSLNDLFPSPGSITQTVKDYRIEATWDGHEGYYQVWFGTRLLGTYDLHCDAVEHIAMARQNDRDVAASGTQEAWDRSGEVADEECPF